MSANIFNERAKEFKLIQEQIAEQLDRHSIYEKETATKKMLLNQVNDLKMSCKLEIDSRRTADEEIAQALSQYERIIETEVIKKRAEVQTKPNQPIKPEPVGVGFQAFNSTFN